MGWVGGLVGGSVGWGVGGVEHGAGGGGHGATVPPLRRCSYTDVITPGELA